MHSWVLMMSSVRAGASCRSKLDFQTPEEIKTTQGNLTQISRGWVCQEGLCNRETSVLTLSQQMCKRKRKKFDLEEKIITSCHISLIWHEIIIFSWGHRVRSDYRTNIFNFSCSGPAQGNLCICNVISLAYLSQNVYSEKRIKSGWWVRFGDNWEAVIPPLLTTYADHLTSST